jgi:hypothetical protein
MTADFIAVHIKPGCAGHLLACAHGLPVRLQSIAKGIGKEITLQDSRRTHAFSISSDR